MAGYRIAGYHVMLRQFHAVVGVADILPLFHTEAVAHFSTTFLCVRAGLDLLLGS